MALDTRTANEMERREVLVQKFNGEYNTDPSEDYGQALEQALAEHR